MKKSIIIIGLVFAANGAFAQDVQSSQPDASTTTQVTAEVPATSPVARMLPASTSVAVASDLEISSKKIEVGQKFPFFVTNDVTEGGVTVIPRGTKVEATVTFKTGKAIGGKSGKFELSFDKISLNGKDYAMRGTHRQEGKGNTVAAVFATWLVSGRSAVMLPGQAVTAFTNEPIPY